MIRLRNINMNKFKPSVNRLLAQFDGRRMVKIDIHLYIIRTAVITHHIANILAATHRLNFAGAHLNHYRRLQLLRCLRNRLQCFLVINIKRPDRKALLATAVH